jgi:hypothetical protein
LFSGTIYLSFAGRQTFQDKTIGIRDITGTFVPINSNGYDNTRTINSRYHGYHNNTQYYHGYHMLISNNRKHSHNIASLLTSGESRPWRVCGGKHPLPGDVGRFLPRTADMAGDMTREQSRYRSTEPRPRPIPRRHSRLVARTVTE